MLINLDGRCGGWAAFFHVLIRIQGIANGDITSVDYNSGILDSLASINQKNEIMIFFGSEAINVYTLNDTLGIGVPPMSHFYVKNWTLGTNINDKFFVNHYYNTSAGFSTLPITLLNNKIVTDKEKTGTAAQGIQNPRSEFEDHSIFKFGGKYYDPSYGSLEVNNANEWENNAIDGVGGMVYYTRVNPINGNIDEFLINWLDVLNSTNQQLNIQP